MTTKRAIIAGYLLCAAMFVVGCFSILGNFRPLLSDSESDLQSGRAIVLSENVSADSIKAILLNGGYMNDSRDAALASRWISKIIQTDGTVANLGELNSPRFKIPADTALAFGSEEFAMRVSTDRLRMGMDSDFENRGKNLSSEYGDSSLDGHIEVVVTNRDSDSNLPIDGIAVRLKEYSVDTIVDSGGKESKSIAELKSRVVGFAVTDADGRARFNVEPGRSYSVLPIQPGSQFGRERGTDKGLLEGTLKLSFKQSPHTLSPLSQSTYRMIKADKVLLARSPTDFLTGLLYGATAFLLGWVLVFFVICWRDRMMNTRSDYLMLVILMALTGMGLLASYGMNNPLIDRDNGTMTATALLIGLAAMTLVSSINFVKFYNGKSRLQMGVIPFDVIDSLRISMKDRENRIEKRSGISISSGFTYLVIAILLILLLALFGTGPEGSNAKVNLGTFQPSEVSKYLIIIFIAAFFAENALLIQSFSERLTGLTFRRQLSTIAVIALVMLALMLVYLKVLSDMGPALVLLITFLLIYSMARRDFVQLLLGGVTFVSGLLIAGWIGMSPWIAALAWFVIWIAVGWLRYHRVYESAILLNLLIVVFLFGAQILSLFGADTEAQRLLSRTGMSGAGVWDNTIEGGDQVAQGLWSLASGGLSGMGIGGGTPSLVPAYHTDMAFTSIGEMMGFVGLVLIVVCMVVLVHRVILIGRKAAHPFVMYLVIGVAFVIGVQFLLIVLGSLGLLPLTGISVPFLSYGRTGLIVTLAMFGVVLSASRLQPTESQRRNAMTHDNAIAAGIFMFILGGGIVITALIKYQLIDRDETLIRPAFITNTSGERIIEYNPRIGLVLDKMEVGDIYDRNGLLLATSSRATVIDNIPSLVKGGLDEKELRAEVAKKRKRYYPFGNHTLFMLGDANTRNVYYNNPSDPIGYVAESRHCDQLRGITFPMEVIEMQSDNYKVNRFVPEISASFKRTKSDYTSLLPYLDYSVDGNPFIDKHNARRSHRNLTLSIDATLQTRLQKDLEKALTTDAQLRGCENLRASVVVLDAANGDLLCSANYPLPVQDSIVKFQRLGINSDAPAEQFAGHSPVTQRDLGLTVQTPPGSTAKVLSAMSALRRNPSARNDFTYTIYSQETIEGDKEPPFGATKGVVGMSSAIVNSSNNYFINVVNQEHLYPELSEIYSTIGARVYPIGSSRTATPYYFYADELPKSDTTFSSIMKTIERQSYKTFDKIYMTERQTGTPRNRKSLRWNLGETGYAWGQGGLLVTPLNMARATAIVANDGKYVPTRFVLQAADTMVKSSLPLPVLEKKAAQALREYMQLESDKHRNRAYGSNLPLAATASHRMGGKTGTPERSDNRSQRDGKSNDAWYICFINSRKLGAPLAIAIRLERTYNYDTNINYQSSQAVRMMADVVLPALEKAGYGVE